MSGQILIVDSIATHRIMLRAALQSAHYEVTPCADIAEAATLLGRTDFDIALIDITQNQQAAFALCAAIKADPVLAGVRIIALASGQDGAARIAALKAGADDVLDRAAGQILLLACIRNLLRARNAAADLSLPGVGDRVTGFAETADGFAGAGRLALVTGRPQALPTLLRKVLDRHAGPTTLIAPGQDLTDTTTSTLADLFVIDAADVPDGGMAASDVIRIVTGLRSSAATHRAATLVVLPDDASDLAALSLDLGANDQVSELVCAEELAHRVRSLLRRKLRTDRQRDQLQFQLQEANIDSLTGLSNRRHAMRRLDRIAEAARHSGKDFAVMMLDIDHFKAINDTHGHATGDRVLAEVAGRLRDNLRAVDLVARLGGEEFLVVMPDTPVDRAQGAAERLRRVIAATPFDNGPARAGLSIRVTMSIGVAVGPSETSPGLSADATIKALFERADTALYAAKSAGRNTVTVAHCAA